MYDAGNGDYYAYGNFDDRLFPGSDDARHRLMALQPHGSEPLLRATPPLTWHQRLRVLRGIARGLVYLHSPSGDKPRVIHRDIKPSNVLLDGQLNARISDVGLARLGSMPTDTHQQARTQNLAGTMGFLDPLFAETFEFSEATAQLLGPPADPKCQLWVTNEYQHNGLRADPNRIFERLLAMAKGELAIPS